jgi:hypothetical protein
LYYRHHRQTTRRKSPLPQPEPSTYLDEPPATQIPHLGEQNAQTTPQNTHVSLPLERTQLQTPQHGDAQEPQVTPGQDITHNIPDSNLNSASNILRTPETRSHTTPLGLPTFMARPPATPPLSPVPRTSIPALPRTPVSLPPSTPSAKPFSPNLGSTAPISNPVTSPANSMKMTYDSFWSSLSATTPVSYKASLATSAQISGLNVTSVKGITEVATQNKR